MFTGVEGVYKARVVMRVERPLFGIPVSAGLPDSAESYIEGYIDPTEYLVKHPNATFFVHVRGDSMLEDGINPGDMLVVDRAISPREGKIIIAIVDGELTVKRFRRKGETIYLVPSNKKYRPISVRKGQDFEVWGVVTFVIHKV
jgi:DNA polymerase V